MKAAENVLDHLCVAALEYEFFPENYTVTRRRFHGAHGAGATHDLIITDDEGRVYRIVAELQPDADNHGVSIGIRRAA